MRTVDANVARRLVCDIFVHAGCCDAEAGRIAQHLVDADLRGHPSHGIARAARYVQWLDDGVLKANQSITIVSENEVLAVVDGNYGFGQTIGEQTVDYGIALAARHGIAVTALRNSGHLGCISDWAERAAHAGLASIHFVNVRGSLLVAPFGGRQARGGTSPICCGVPLHDEDPIVLDFATSKVAEGKALVALRGGAPVGDDAFIGPDGVLSGDPKTIYGDGQAGLYPRPGAGGGALTAFGLHKGSGLNFFVEMFAGALTGSGTAGALNEPGRRPLCNGMLSIYLSVDRFHSDDWLDREINSYIEFFKSSSPLEPDGEVLVPGEKERRLKRERSISGIPVAEGVWLDLMKTADHVGIGRERLDEMVAGSNSQ
ncbi:MAG: malate dehydrogenase [Rhizobiales bacterium]|nr:malate dehydrogenase [Hyphomicrobiales bacterium]